MYDVLYERPHLHIRKGYDTSIAKIWLDDFTFSETGRFTDKELNLVQKLVIKNQRKLIKSFEELQNNQRPKTYNLKLE